MSFLKKSTLLVSVLAGLFTGINQNVLFADDFKAKINKIFVRAKKTNMIDLTTIDIESLDDKELEILKEKLGNSRENADNIIFSSNNKVLEIGNRDNVSTNMMENRLDDLSIKLRSIIKEALNCNYQIFNINPKKCTHNKFYKNDECERQALFNMIDTAYDIGYLDFTKNFKLEEILKNDIRVTSEHCKDTLLGRLKELTSVYDFSLFPIEVLMNEKECKKVKDTDVIKNFFKSETKKRFEFAKDEKKTNSRLDVMCKYMTENNVIDLTALNIDDFSEQKLLELFEKFGKLINSNTRIIYLKNMRDFLRNEKAKAFYDNIVKCIKDKSNRYEITLDERFTIQQRLHLGYKTRQLILDDEECKISFPVISKLLLRAYNTIESGKKKEKLKIKIYGDFFEHEDLKKMLSDNKNIDVTIDKFDKTIYDTINKKLFTSEDDCIDLKLIKLNAVQKRGSVDLMKACIENYLASNENKKSIQLEIKASDNTIIKDLENLKKKYKNLNVIKY